MSHGHSALHLPCLGDRDKCVADMQQRDACDELLSVQAGPVQGNCAGKQSLSIFVASGPFSSKDDVHYEPLQAVLDHCNERPPQVLVLLGPFVDAQHPAVQAGTLHDTFDEIFAAQVRHRLHMHVLPLNVSTRGCCVVSVPPSSTLLLSLTSLAQNTMQNRQMTEALCIITVKCQSHDSLCWLTQDDSDSKPIEQHMWRCTLDGGIHVAHHKHQYLPADCPGMCVSKA